MTEQNKRQGNTNELPEKQLIKIVDWCYKRCLKIAKEQNNKIHETLWEVVRFIHFLGAKPKEAEHNKRIQCNIDVEDKMMIAAMEPFEEKAKSQLQCSTTLIDAVRKKCCEDYISSNPDSLASAKHFIMKCSELCWHVLSSNPPMVIDYENFEEQPMDPNKFNKYNRSGTTVEYVVWPALILHKDGPVLAKGTVQTNYEDKTAHRKKSADNIFAPPKRCKPTDTPTTKDDYTSNKMSDAVQCTKDSLKGDSHAKDSELRLTKPNNKDQLNDLSKKVDFKSIDPLCNSKKEKENKFNVDPGKQLSAHKEQDVKPGCALKTGDADNIDQSCRCLGKNGESINDQLIEGSSGVTTEGSKEIKNGTSNSAKGDKNIVDKMEETNKNGVKNEFENSSNKVTEHQSKSKNQYENISIKKGHTTRDRQEMKGDELNIPVHQGVKTQTEVMDAIDSKPHDDKYEPEPFSLDGSINPPTHSWESNTDDKYESPGNNQTVNANDGIPDSPTVSNIESKIKFYSKEGNQLNGPHQRTGTIQRELDKGCGINQSEVVQGMVFKRYVEGDVTKATNCKVAVYSCPLDSLQTETKGTVIIKSADELMNYSKGEENQIEAQIKSISDAGCSTAPTATEAGHCDRVYVDEIGDTSVIIFKQDKEESAIATIVIRGSTDNIIDDVERAVDDGINTFKALTKNGKLLPGAGATEIELAKQITTYGEGEPGLEQYAIKKFAESLENLPRAIAENAGAKATEVLSRLYAAHHEGKKNAGLDIETQGVGIKDSTEMKLVDLYLSKYWGLKFATQAACTILTVDQIIMAKAAGGPKPKENKDWDED
ncbi:CCT8 [Mytilus edulis]|uniref:CCT8 n=1 Tax=Mytilus edulis TaxID=6550 RepID=A0A8S3SD13_MYTED|nr:CCT8 [Mytilus edulis]